MGLPIVVCVKQVSCALGGKGTLLCQDGSRRNQHVLCLGIVQLHSIVGLSLSEISVVYVIVKRQKIH